MFYLFYFILIYIVLFERYELVSNYKVLGSYHFSAWTMACFVAVWKIYNSFFLYDFVSSFYDRYFYILHSIYYQVHGYVFVKF